MGKWYSRYPIGISQSWYIFHNEDNLNLNQGRGYAYTSLTRAFTSQEQPVIRTFINGFDVTSNVLQLATAPANLEGTKLTIGISVGAAT